MVSIGVITYNPLILTFDPNFQPDIQDKGIKHPLKYTMETNISPENQWLEDAFPIEMVPFLGGIRSCSGRVSLLKMKASYLSFLVGQK